MPAPAIIQDLVSRFRNSRELYRSGRYNEAQLRLEFLNPLFEALGWDMSNRSNFAPQYREVIHEDSLEVEGSAKAPDYAFRIGTTRKFFVEAKKPAVDIRYAIHPAYQLRRYAWNAHLPLSILTDFEELAVYDCRTRPDPKDSAATGRVMLFTFEEYLTRWDELAQIFSRDAVWNGSFDRYAEGSKGKRGTTEVDAEFLKEIEEWRLLLARNIALRNFRSAPANVIASEARQSPSGQVDTDSTPSGEGDKGAKSPELAEGSGSQTINTAGATQSPSLHTSPLNLPRLERQLNYAVQTTIDRILFLRICEDRGIEPPDQLRQIAEGSEVYLQLLQLFKKADLKYNSGLFHFSKEKGQTSKPDTFTPNLQIDDKILRQIIKSTYYPCPYMFNEIPVEILGQVYEQFLGKVIRLTPGGVAKVEEKPEVRKAGGVYYTPRYIVDYIVQNTLGRLLNGNATPTEAKQSPNPDAPQDPPPSSPSLRPQEGLEGVGSSQSLLGETGTNINSQQSGYADHTPSSEAVGGGLGGGSTGESVSEPTGSASVTPSSAAVGGGLGGGSNDLCQDKQVETLRSKPMRGRETGTNNENGKNQSITGHTPSGEGDKGSGSVNQSNQFHSLTPAEALKLRVVDPACGSGSFLLGAFQYLLDWHLNYYLSHDPQSHTRGKNPPLVATEGGEYRLTTETKKRILTSSIHGVDIDSQAVEVTKLSLLLKLLEGETGQLSLGFERVLPDLGNNIRCGNSLIGWDYFKGQIFPDEEEIQRVNPFDWQRAFPHVFAEGGFDAVIGNPPYVRFQNMKEWGTGQIEYFKKSFKSASKGNYDVYVVFVENGTRLLNSNGLLGYILPNKFFTSNYGEPLRDYLSEKQAVCKIIDFGDLQVFSSATTYTCLLFLSSTQNAFFDYQKVGDLQTWYLGSQERRVNVDSGSINNAPWTFIPPFDRDLFAKLNRIPTKLGDIANLFVGLQTSADPVFLFKNSNKGNGNFSTVHSTSLSKDIDLENELLKKVIRSGQIGRYWAKPNALVLFPYRLVDNKATLISSKELQSTFSKAWQYLVENRKTLLEREHGKFKSSGWYQLYPKNLDLWEQPKILIPYMVTRLAAYFDQDDYYFVNVTTGGFGLTLHSSAISFWYITALLNSKLLDWYFVRTSSRFHGGYFAAGKQYLVSLPVILANEENEEQIQDIIQYAKKISELQKSTPVTPLDIQNRDNVVKALDMSIDNLVYALYCLTDEEIRIVESHV